MPRMYPGMGPDCKGVDCADSHSWRASESQITQPKSSDSRMIEENDIRASLWPISTAIESRAPAMTAAVTGSTRVFTLLIGSLSSPKDQVARLLGLEAPARRHERGGVGVKDDRGAGQRLAGRQRLTVVEAGEKRFEFPVHAKDAVALADQRTLGVPGTCLHPGESRPLADRAHPRVDDLDRVAE